jgi:Fe/S biogenesis protein NfuA
MMTLTDRALEVVRSYMDQSSGELTALRIAVSGGTPAAPDFELTLVGPDEIHSGEIKLDVSGLTIVVDEETAPRLEDATVDFVERVNESGFEVRLATSAATPSAAPTGALAEKVRDVLENQINPAIASHGGVITLVDVQDTEIYVEMGGGCQGCAMSRMTLRQGVERMVRQAVPEITVIHDITDHSSGENPFFEGAG